MCVGLCVRVYLCMYACIHARIHVYVYMCNYVCVNVYVLHPYVVYISILAYLWAHVRSLYSAVKGKAASTCLPADTLETN